MTGNNRQTEQTIGIVSLSLMGLFVILSVLVNPSEDITPMLIIGAIIFLIVGLVMITGTTGGSSGGSSQQQSVVLADGHMVMQGGRHCTQCGHSAPPGARFCPRCGSEVQA